MRRRLASWAMISLLVMSAGCGYATRGLYNEQIETVSVPIFKVKGLRRDDEFQLTETVIKAIEAQTPYKVVQTDADTELRGTIQSIYKSPYGEDGYDNPRGGIMNMSLTLTWVDLRTGAVLREKSQTFTLDDNASYLIDLGQSQATAQQQLYDDMAGYVVSLMQAPW